MNYYSGDSIVSNSKLWKGGNYETFKKDVYTALLQLPTKIEKYRPSFATTSSRKYELKDLILDVNSSAKLVLGLVTLAEMEKPSSQESDHSKGAAIEAFVHSCVQTLTQLSKLNQTFSELLKFFKDEIKTEMMLSEYEESQTKRIVSSLNHQQASSLTIPKSTTTFSICNSSSCQQQNQQHQSSPIVPSSQTFPVFSSNSTKNFSTTSSSSPNVPSATSPHSVNRSSETLPFLRKENILNMSKLIEETSIDSKSSVLYLSLSVIQRAVHEHPKMITWLFGKAISSSSTR